MRDDKSKKSKLSWSKKMVRKWFNIKSKTEEFQADVSLPQVEHRSSISEKEPCTIKKTKTEKLSKNWEQQARQRRMNYENPRIIDVQNYSIFVATWNVAGRSPPEDLNLDEWLHSSAPADIYVLGFQEIVPLNAGNVLGAEDNGPAKKWHSLIRKTLNNLPGTSGGVSHTPSPIPVPIAEIDADFSGSSRQKNATFFNRRSFQTPSIWRADENDSSVSQPPLERRLSVCDRVFFTHRPSDFDPSFRCNHRPSDYSRASDYYSRPSDYYSRASDYSRQSDVSRCGYSDEDNGPGDSPSTGLYSPASNENGSRISWNSSQYCLVASKQMVGIFLTVWVKSELREHVKNMKVSCVGRGLMGYLGNKGSISISMLLHQTSFCFVCTHLTSGQKEGDELRRNSDVMEILKKTRFPRVLSSAGEKSPENILQHDRVIWLGDLNYRIALSYRSAKALVEMKNWRALLENDQLRIEQKRGHVFKGWDEGKIYFPPTYKYSTNSDRYAGDDLHPKEKRRTPAWCDRILWYGEGLHQLCYVRGESRFSDHRPVYGIFSAEVESNHKRLKRTTSYSTSRVQAEELLPYPRGYTELTFF
ncbi:CVP2 like 1 [Raphanus sativus]|uniref:Type IV inositol polyphosphate 5-phosphatase 7 n=1 Tax=Raphanus sativus TaxID=3726 RepID=A0A6J0MYR4_RAPSA|nr:type IV inositol polyphosphate 5-phosphatase 7 [Raphanus sativus]KAJ4903401.1 CVP2 like 1 [Raphanus sativus]